ncbi:proline iminopeptidase [Arthrobacter sp. PGP41]|uniref:proline iminopeptidase-family hydrolase n=1 Tax=unclassified Arthrobacter TaxID=235627 RepID=UPI000CDCE007|nr:MULTISPECIES: proline iminopeptidase-family hydrolase [unclassified Arthrobacter]AUZ33793.1 proline iminopeptidase [Arthrobacter sp. PGP41]MDT0195527.1 proline iminopeptidase-family hydrolase [Arthrobacter sp. AB6]
MSAGVSTREGRLQVPGGGVWYRVVGDSPAVPLVIVHGGPGATHDYLEPLEAMADERPVVFYDQLGAGKSDAPDDIGLWTNERLVDELGRILDGLALDRVHLLGHSWGTIVAAEYALRAPDRLAGLVLADPCLSLPRYAETAAALRGELPAEVRAVLDRHEAAGTTDSDEYQDASMEFYRRHVCRLDPWPEPLMRTFGQLNQVIYERMQGPSEFQITGIHKDYDATGRLGDLSVPTLFICGRHDEMRPEDTAWYHSLVPASELVIFENSSHMPHLEEPDLFLQVLRDFLRRAEQAT